MDFEENNLYLNTTFRTRTQSRINYFAGVAYGWFERNINGALVAGDRFRERESELHIKSKADKRFSNLYKLEFGAESFVKSYNLNYRDTESVNPKIEHNITGLYISNDLNPVNNLLLNASVRGEYSSSNSSFAILPRIAISYNLKELILSGVVGRYQQTSSREYLIYNKRLSNERNWQYQVGLYYQKRSKVFRAELYYKDYEKLTDKRADHRYGSDGYGYSRGIDLFFNDRELFKNWDYILSYTFNDSKRKYLDYPKRVQPHYVTRHNASISIRYTNFTDLRSIIGVSYRWASGRPYNNPNEDRFMEGRTSHFHTLDISWTILAHKNLIIYASVSNILNRKNIYGYNYDTHKNSNGLYDRKPVTLEQPQSFYIGFFITLGKNAAYETSHF